MEHPTLPLLGLNAPGFSTRSDEVLRDRRFRQGSHAWPEMVGLTGSFADFRKRSVISLEGEPHRAMRRLAQVALA